MNITEIIGKGKAFEPPFTIGTLAHKENYIFDGKQSLLCKIEIGGEFDKAVIVANHIVELLNERWKDDK